MDTVLLGALSSDTSIRTKSNQFLHESEKLPGFCTKLIETFEIGTEQVCVLSLISLKNCVQKYWSNQKRIPQDEKEKIKSFFIVNVEISENLRKFLYEGIIAINKYEYLENWKGLIDYLSLFKPNESYLFLLHSIIKVQLRKASSRCRTSLKTMFITLSQYLIKYWRQTQDIFSTKIVIKSLVFNYSEDLCSDILAQANLQITSNLSLNLTKTIIKGLNYLINQSSSILAPLLQPFLNLYLEISLSPIQQNQIYRETIELCFTGLQELISKFPLVASFVEPFAERLLDKSLKIDQASSIEYSTVCDEGDLENFLLNIEESEAIRGFQLSLMQNFKALFGKLTEILKQDLNWDQLHSFSNILGLMAKFSGSCDQDYQVIVNKFIQVQVSGLHRLVLFIDLLNLTKKWLSFLKDLQFVLNLLINIKNSTNDFVVLYECCIVLKQITYKPIPIEALVKIVEEFGLIAFDLIGKVQTPSCVWHLAGFIRNLIESSENNEVFIKALKDFGLQRLIIDNNEMTCQSIGDMLETLLVKNKGNDQINEAFSSNLQARLMRGDKEAYAHWLVFLINFSGNIQFIDSLLQFFPLMGTKLYQIQVKIAEEYLMIYHELSLYEKIDQLVETVLNGFQFFTRDYEKDYLSIELLFCVSSVALPKFRFIDELLSYLLLSRDDMFELLCVQNSLLVLCRYLLSNAELMARYNLIIFFESLKALSHHNQLAFASSAVKRIINFIPSDVMPALETVLAYQESQILDSANSSMTQSLRFSRLFH